MHSFARMSVSQSQSGGVLSSRPCLSPAKDPGAADVPPRGQSRASEDPRIQKKGQESTQRPGGWVSFRLRPGPPSYPPLEERTKWGGVSILQVQLHGLTSPSFPPSSPTSLSPFSFSLQSVPLSSSTRLFFASLSPVLNLFSCFPSFPFML